MGVLVIDLLFLRIEIVIFILGDGVGLFVVVWRFDCLFIDEVMLCNWIFFLLKDWKKKFS